ncbi:hypothetical protein DFH08DRAFT_816957 [Mycena albidolilacea]|uniref:Uncharacterized protein n=1 Tax=Mycena albidolilacea TaxID=1033008 RepID=A0AAD7EI55_9AGAR|nr:hypothetical protein DFH08DRAFT_816957 [Mycena albidolilacea]
MKGTFFVALFLAAGSFAASLSRETFRPPSIHTIDAARYKAASNGTISVAELFDDDKRGNTLQKRDAGNVSLCTAANWKQYCVYITNAGPNDCVNLASDLNDLVSSFGPDPNQSCTMFADSRQNFGSAADCNPSVALAVGPIVSPGVSDLSQPFNIGQGQIVNGFNDVLSSYS